MVTDHAVSWLSSGWPLELYIFRLLWSCDIEEGFRSQPRFSQLHERSLGLSSLLARQSSSESMQSAWTNCSRLRGKQGQCRTGQDAHFTGHERQAFGTTVDARRCIMPLCMAVYRHSSAATSTHSVFCRVRR